MYKPKHVPRKRFGQHFLHDSFIIQQIITAINPQINEHLVEIGPGLGALTKPMLALVGKLDAIEFDRDIIPHLQRSCAELGQLCLHAADALKFDYHSLVHNNESLRIFGNLPYNISTPLIFHLLKQAAFIQDMHFMLQKEVVDRIVAQPGNLHYGRLSIMVQYFCQTTALLEVPPQAFTPPPRVDSAVVRLIPYLSPPIPALHFATFAKIVETAFNQRRKTIRNALKPFINIENAAVFNQFANARPEQLSISNFVAISDAVGQLS